jgi:hypothetical protein
MARGHERPSRDEQLNLLLALLEKRPTVTHVAPLCNIPVFLWPWFDDRYVPVEQARRALMTWGGANQHSPDAPAIRLLLVPGGLAGDCSDLHHNP